MQTYLESDYFIRSQLYWNHDFVNKRGSKPSFKNKLSGKVPAALSEQHESCISGNKVLPISL